MNRMDAALAIFKAGVRAVMPEEVLRPLLKRDEAGLYIGESYFTTAATGRLVVVAAGKAAAAMMQVAELQLGDAISEALCITKYHHALPLQKARLLEAAHPVPDENSLLAGGQLLHLVEGLVENDVLLLLLSGGASALAADLPGSCTLDDVQAVFQALLQSGANIGEMNAVRKHLSCIKGGQLARAASPATVITLAISDVPGDDPGTIGSGPTVPDESTFQDAVRILKQFALWEKLPAAVAAHLTKGISGAIPETPKPGDSCFANCRFEIIARNQTALQAAGITAMRLGFCTQLLNRSLHGDTVENAETLTQKIPAYNGPTPACFLTGGETTLQVTGSGKGGRNQHFALAALRQMQALGIQNITILSAGTDGTDGPTDATGAIAASSVIAAANQKGLDATAFFNNCDSYHFFAQTGGLVKTGPTQTNVMDMVVVIMD